MDYLQYLTVSLIPSVPIYCFKPYYKWITFNIEHQLIQQLHLVTVLNLIINGLPSIFNSKEAISDIHKVQKF